MSKAQFDDNCRGCRPVIIDAATGLPMGPETPEMVAVNGVWETTTREEREAFHDFTCLNSRDLKVMELVAAIHRRITDALQGLKP